MLITLIPFDFHTLATNLFFKVTLQINKLVNMSYLKGVNLQKALIETEKPIDLNNYTALLSALRMCDFLQCPIQCVPHTSIT